MHSLTAVLIIHLSLPPAGMQVESPQTGINYLSEQDSISSLEDVLLYVACLQIKLLDSK